MAATGRQVAIPSTGPETGKDISFAYHEFPDYPSRITSSLSSLEHPKPGPFCFSSGLCAAPHLFSRDGRPRRRAHTRTAGDATFLHGPTTSIRPYPVRWQLPPAAADASRFCTGRASMEQAIAKTTKI